MASQPIYLWGWLVLLTNCLKITSGFVGIFTEAVLHIAHYLSYAKSSLVTRLPVGSSGSSFSSPLISFSTEKETVLSTISLLRSVSLPNVKWKRPSISITVLLSCVPVRLGLEDAMDFVSTILRGADWMLTSLLGVTNSQVSGCAVNLVSTHLSSTLNLLSIYLRVLASSYYVMLYVCGVCISSITYCSVNV
ncbi:hypothetical protein Rs2_36951 [Raphanus sativus]|nr:hypothetical protein Rs2_36951 [Raphanus sativus]